MTARWVDDVRAAVDAVGLLDDVTVTILRPVGGEGVFDPDTYDVIYPPPAEVGTATGSVGARITGTDSVEGHALFEEDTRMVRLPASFPQVEVGDLAEITPIAGDPNPQLAGTWTVRKVLGHAAEITRRLIVTRDEQMGTGA